MAGEDLLESLEQAEKARGDEASAAYDALQEKMDARLAEREAAWEAEERAQEEERAADASRSMEQRLSEERNMRSMLESRS